MLIQRFSRADSKTPMSGDGGRHRYGRRTAQKLGTGGKG